jgi:hypothetical protein
LMAVCWAFLWILGIWGVRVEIRQWRTDISFLSEGLMRGRW